jgi:Raf kinase inhibitor-like YbhB/YbcL family protein
VISLRTLVPPLGIALLALAACGGGDDEPDATASPENGPTETADAAEFTLSSNAFQQEEPIPERYTCEGANVSPDLSWENAPEETESFALIVDDPDAPAGTFTHWLIFDLTADTTFLPENIEVTERPAAGGVQGTNDGSRNGYTGPCPPSGSPHRYVFTLYALDGELGLEPGVSKAEIVTAMDDHILAETSLTGTFER